VPTSIKRSFFWPGVVEEPSDVPKRPLLRRESEVDGGTVGVEAGVAEGTVMDTGVGATGTGIGATGTGVGATGTEVGVPCATSVLGGIRFFSDSSRLLR
jgi:hypothetical protein